MSVDLLKTSFCITCLHFCQHSLTPLSTELFPIRSFTHANGLQYEQGHLECCTIVGVFNDVYRRKNLRKFGRQGNIILETCEADEHSEAIID
jgi:hypothetical protein